MKRREFSKAVGLTACMGLGGALSSAAAQNAWTAIEQAARGQTVHFNAWAGSESINAYIQWAASELRSRHGVTLQHVKISDAAEVVRRIRTEKAAGRVAGQGTVDLIWVNGENFAALKKDGLLFGPWVAGLPNFAAVDTQGKPTTLVDFSVPTDGLEAPWGMAQLTFFADARRLPTPPQSLSEWLDLARREPGRLSYPRPPDFHGTTFVKQALIEFSPDPSALSQPVDSQRLATQTAGLWRFLDALHPLLWRQGRQFPASAAVIRQAVADGELLVGLSFNPNEAASEIAAGRLPATVQSWQFQRGTIANTHFVAIPYNAPSTAAAQVVANFLLSPQAQARKADVKVWGDPTVLDVSRLNAADQVLFNAPPLPGQVRRTAPALAEPHASWVEAVEREWTRRYGV
jgi:putative thiamine transport system substrate-binding protein